MQNSYRTDAIPSAWPEDGLEDVPECPVCSSRDRYLLYSGLTDRILFCAPGEWTLYRCLSCESAYLDPRPTKETIGLAYLNYFTHLEYPDFASLGLSAKIRRALANGYRNWRFGTNENPASVLGVLAALMLPNVRATLDAGMRYLPKPNPGQRLLDIGCGNGAFLYRARSAGWDVVGVDVDPNAIELARKKGLHVFLGRIEELTLEGNQFDVITLSHVIEHVHSPIETLRACYRLLKRGGYIWIDTPNLNSEGHRLFGRNWRGLEPTRHLVLFNHRSLQFALQKAGFSGFEIEPYRPLCDSIFRASLIIAKGVDSNLGKEQEYEMLKAIKISERRARQDPERREFITIRAWKTD